jgi:UDP-glucose 4-epimerase
LKVLITGSSGFLGSWIVRVLSSKHEVVSLVRKTSSLRKLEGIQDIKLIKVDESQEALAICDEKPDVLIINDWWGVGNEFRNDLRQLDNLKRMHAIALAGRSANVKVVIGVGSQAELGSVEAEIHENSKSNPSTIYGEAKVKSRLLMNQVFKESDARFVWMRIFSTYGPLDEGSWLIPNIVNSLASDEEIALTKGEQEWSYLHAYDLAMAFAAVIESASINGIVNVGNPETISIRSAAITIGKILAKEELLHFGALEYRPDQVMRLQPICENLTKIGWRPEIAFDDGVKQTIDWLMRKDVSNLKTREEKFLNFNLPVRL